jgi:MraZ protein
LSFLGQFEFALDAKNRLTVPARFRGELSGGIVLAKGLDPCVSVFPGKAWDGFIERALGGRDPFSQETRRLQRFFHATAFESKLDSAGRIMLPQTLIEHGGLGKDVMIVGNLDHVEVWQRERWREHEADITENAEPMALRLSGAGDTST